MATMTFNLELDDGLYQKIEKEYDDGNFTAAVRTAILYLTECIRERTDLDIDGDSLVTKAFTPNNPLIKINNLNTTSEKDEQSGHMQMMQGLYKGIRNPRNHNLREDSSNDFYGLISMINYFVLIVKKSKKKFEVDSYLKIINDRLFVSSCEYSEELVKTIPSEKKLDLSIFLLENVSINNFKNMGVFLNRLIQDLTDEQFSQLNKYCSNKLMGTEDYSLIKVYIFMFKECWEKIEKAPRIRIENHLIDCLNKTGVTYIEDQDDYGNFFTDKIIDEDGEMAKYLNYLPQKYAMSNAYFLIYSNLEQKLQEDEIIFHHIFNWFGSFIFDDHTTLKNRLNDTFVSLLNNDKEYVYDTLISVTYSNGEADPDFYYNEEIRIAIKEYENRQIPF